MAHVAEGICIEVQEFVDARVTCSHWKDFNLTRRAAVVFWKALAGRPLLFSCLLNIKPKLFLYDPGYERPLKERGASRVLLRPNPGGLGILYSPLPHAFLQPAIQKQLSEGLSFQVYKVSCQPGLSL